MADERGQGGEFNPYKAPVAQVEAQPRAGAAPAAGEPTGAMIENLRGTGPWALFLAIIGFIGAGFMLLSGMAAIVMMPFVEAAQADGGSGASSSGVFAFTGAFYLAGGASYGVAAYFLARFSQSVARVNETRTLDDVERAIGAQHRFWRATGLVTIVFVGFTTFFLVGVIAYVTAMVATAPSGVPAL